MGSVRGEWKGGARLSLGGVVEGRGDGGEVGWRCWVGGWEQER